MKRRDTENAVRYGIVVKVKIPRALYREVRAAAKAVDRSMPYWILEQLRDGVAEAKVEANGRQR